MGNEKIKRVCLARGFIERNFKEKYLLRDMYKDETLGIGRVDGRIHIRGVRNGDKHQTEKSDSAAENCT